MRRSEHDHDRTWSGSGTGPRQADGGELRPSCTGTARARRTASAVSDSSAATVRLLLAGGVGAAVPTRPAVEGRRMPHLLVAGSALPAVRRSGIPTVERSLSPP